MDPEYLRRHLIGLGTHFYFPITLRPRKGNQENVLCFMDLVLKIFFYL